MLCGTVALLATMAVNGAYAAVGHPVTADDHAKQINKCIAMSPDALAADTDCADMMKQKNLTVADMQTVKTCKAMKPDMMAKDDTCTAMADKHPDIMKPTPQ
jgi:hypothetical protein